MARRRKGRGRWLLLGAGVALVAAAAAKGDEPQREGSGEPQRVPGEPQRVPGPGPSTKDGRDTVVFEATIIFDQTPDPAGYDVHDSVVSLPAFMGGGSRAVPFTLGYPRSWIPKGRQTATLAEFSHVPELRVWVEGDATSDVEKALGGNPNVWIPCHRWAFVGKTADGPVAWDAAASGQLAGGDQDKGKGSRCNLQIPAERPEVGIDRKGDVYRLLFSPEPGGGGVVRYRITIEVVKP